jgi:8-oxo-dGTP pyrophosphatase MutT (NUDIX family)
LINRLKTALAAPLPGVEAQYLMAPDHRRRILTEELGEREYRPSAVMIVLCEDAAGQIFIPLTERMAYKGHHSGQISLPGGKPDPADPDLEHTALRECREEIGIREMETLGKLTPLFIPVSRFLVHPYLSVCQVKNPLMTSQEREVKNILRLGLDQLMDDKRIKEGRMTVSGNLQIRAPWFDVEGQPVWGATAMILSELKQILRTIS